VNLFKRVYRLLSRDDDKSRRSLWPLIFFLLFGIVFFGYRAAVQNDSASRQQTSFGTIIQCEQRGRGMDNYCHYMFPVGDELYSGVSNAEPGVGYGQKAKVYYDSQDPWVSTLEDFSEQSRTSMHFACFLVLALAATVAFTLWDRSPNGSSE
jgi:hypothetical protein